MKIYLRGGLLDGKLRASDDDEASDVFRENGLVYIANGERISISDIPNRQRLSVFDLVNGESLPVFVFDEK
jgi:hypothetical protein